MNGETIMNKAMENLISHDLGMNIEDIREATWEELLKIPYNKTQKRFRPKNMFLVSGNINLAQNRTMGMRGLDFKNTIRKALYKIRCLMKHKS